MEVTRGMRSSLDNLFDLNQEIKVRMLIDGSATYDFVCFGVDIGNKLSDDRYMIFYNQTESPKTEIKYNTISSGAEFSIKLNELPNNIQKLVFTASIDGKGAMGEISSHTFYIEQGNKEKVIGQFNGKDFSQEKAITSFEIYRKNGWRFNVIVRGFKGGLDSLLEFYGGENADKEEVQQEVKPEVQPTVKPEVQPTVKPEVQPTVRPQVQPTVRSQVQSTVNPEVQPTVRPQVQPVARPQAQPTVRPQVQPVTSTQAQPTGRPQVQPVTTSQTQPTGRPQVQPVTTSQTQPTVRPQVQPVTSTQAQSTVRPQVQPVTSSQAQPTVRPQVQPATSTQAQPIVRPQVQPVTSSQAQPTVRPQVQPVTTSQENKIKGSLEKKIQENAPKLISFVNPLVAELKKRNLENTTARVVLALDIADSMENSYDSGIIQGIVNKILPIAVQFDENGELDFWHYANKSRQKIKINMKNYASAVPKDWEYLTDLFGATNNEAVIIEKITEEYKDSNIPVYVIFVTDGGIYEDSKIKKMLIESSKLPIFWQFVGASGSDYGILEHLGNIKEREIENSKFFKLDDFSLLPNSELYSRLLKEFPNWLKEAKR